MSQVHDNVIVSYQADFESEQLILKTKYYYDGAACENTDIIFKGYFTHIFSNEQKGSIIFGIEERMSTYFCERERELIEKNRKHCWPINYQTPDTKGELNKFIQDNGYKVFDISSSYGLCGWVLAKRMEIVVSEV